MLFQIFRVLCGSAYNVNVDLNGSIDDRLCVGLIEQIHQDLALLHRDTGVSGNGITVENMPRQKVWVMLLHCILMNLMW